MGYRMEWQCDHCLKTEFSHPRHHNRAPVGWSENETLIKQIDGEENEFLYFSLCPECNDQWQAMVAARDNAWRRDVNDFIKGSDGSR